MSRTEGVLNLWEGSLLLLVQRIEFSCLLSLPLIHKEGLILEEPVECGVHLPLQPVDRGLGRRVSLQVRTVERLLGVLGVLFKMRSSVQFPTPSHKVSLGLIISLLLIH